MSSITNFIRQIIRGPEYLEVDKTLNEGEKRRIRFINYIGILAFGNMLLYLCIYLILDSVLYTPALITLSLVMTGLFGVIYLNIRRNPRRSAG